MADPARDALEAIWIETWLSKVAEGEAAMSHRKLASIAAHGSLDAVTPAARAKGVHLVQLTDERGDVLLAASRHPCKSLC